MTTTVSRVGDDLMLAMDGGEVLAAASRVHGDGDRWAVALKNMAEAGHRFLTGERTTQLYLEQLSARDIARSDQPNGQPSSEGGGR